MIEPKVLTHGAATIVFDGSLQEPEPQRWFDAVHWQREGRLLTETTGRGSVRVLDRGTGGWVLRHYNRGGFVSRFVQDHYLWMGLERSRAFREWRVLARLHELELPAPRPVAARVLRDGLIYQADIVTAYLPDTRPLSAFLNEGKPLSHRWLSIGRMLRAFHDNGVYHPDLTAHNILLGFVDGVYLVDFDNARLRAPGRWREAGIKRLERSLRKVAMETGTAFDDEGWQLLVKGYRG